MKVLQELRLLRDSVKKPITRVVEQGRDFKMLGIALSKGVNLKEHMTKIASKLVIVEGTVLYREDAKAAMLDVFEEFQIPINKMHSLYALEDSLCLLIQSK